MRSYRIGKTLKIRWGILTGGKSEPLSGRDLRLEIATGSRFRRNVPFEADDSVAEFLFQGSEQRYVGAYTLTMWENRGKENQTVVDRCDAFCLVACSCEESAESADEPNLDVETLELGSSNLETGVPGMSAYELFKRHNPDSALTEEEYAEAPVVEADRAAALADNPPKIVEVEGVQYWAFWNEATKQYVTSEYPARGEKGDPGDSGGGSNVNIVQGTGQSTTNIMSQKAVTDELGKKVNAEEGKGLSTNDYTNEEKTKVTSAVLVTKQELTSYEKKQVLTNIGTASTATITKWIGDEAAARKEADAQTLSSAKSYTDSAVDAIRNQIGEIGAILDEINGVEI
ncbi:MAG TPA: hypothetical protein H9995_04010 [Candidatus Alistipes excrementigallinarum]|nr:hypothetical protein [Candidatus Alistipes excrementigallinarum]